MKKALAVLLVVCICATMFACASMSSFKDNLGSDYKKTTLTDSDIEDYADLLGLDMDEYKIRSAIEAKHKTKYTSVVIIECGSSGKAKSLAKDADEIVDLLKLTYGSKYSFGIETKGCFVLFGETSAIKDALGK